MSADQRFTLIITGIGLMFSMLVAIIGLIWRAGNKQGETSQQIKEQGQDIKAVTESLDKHIAWHLGNTGTTRPRRNNA